MTRFTAIQNFIISIRQLFFVKEGAVSMVICIAWACILLKYVKAIANRVPVLNSDTDLTVTIFVVILVVISIPWVWKRFVLADYLFYIAWVLLFGLNYFVYPNNENALVEWAFPCLCAAVPYYFIGRMLDINKYWNIFVWLSGICIVTDALYYMAFVQSMKSARDAAEILKDDNMYASYQLLPHVLMMFWATMRRFNIFTLLLGFLGLVLILSFGSRGPMACLGFFCILYFFCFMKFKYSTYIKVGIVGLCGMAIPLLVEITFALKVFFEEFGLSTRIVDRILRGGLTHDTGRSSIRDKLYNILDNSDNIFGFGIYGCERYGIIYAHNFFCDIFFTFGYYAGSIIIIAFLSLLLYAFIIAKSMERQGLLFLFSLSFVKLMLSNTFIADSFFFMLIGYSVYVIFKNNCDPKLVLNEN